MLFLFCIGSLYQQFLDGLLTELPSYRCKFIVATTVSESRLTNKIKKETKQNTVNLIILHIEFYML